MDLEINTKELRKNMSDVIRKVKKDNQSYTVFYRSSPAFKIVPIKKRKSPEEINKFLEKFKDTLKDSQITNNPAEDKEVIRKIIAENHD